jgi:hypothetical protein
LICALFFEIEHAEFYPVGYSSYGVKIHKILHRSGMYQADKWPINGRTGQADKWPDKSNLKID